MKIKIFTNRFSEDLESEVNSFLKSDKVEVIDIKYTAVPYDNVYYSCMVLYEEVQYEKSR